MGRPAIEITPELCEKAESLAAQGLTLEQIALVLGMCYDTLNEKSKEFSEFSDAIKGGQAKGVAVVTNKLFERAKGLSYQEAHPMKLKEVTYDNGKRVKETERVEIVMIEKKVHPDTTAQIFYLKNRAGWKDKTELDIPSGLTIKITKDDASLA